MAEMADLAEGGAWAAEAFRAMAEAATLHAAEATARIIDLARRELTRGRRLLIGFDFPFGYPAGTAARLCMRGLAWRNFWQTLDNIFIRHR